MSTGLTLARAADCARGARMAILETLLLLDSAGLEIRPEAQDFVTGLVEDAITFAEFVCEAADGWAHDEVRQHADKQQSGAAPERRMA